MSNYTPAPWYWGEPFETKDKREMIGIGNGAEHIGYVSITSCVRLSEAQANARLIATAPELLEALRDMLKRYGDEDKCWQIDEARKAIAKAEGKAGA